MAHYTLDESDASETEDLAVQGVCWTDECLWRTRWHHADEYVGKEGLQNVPPFDRASDAAETEIQNHVFLEHGIEI